MKPTLKAPGTKRLKLKCHRLLSTFAFDFNLRRYITTSKLQCESPHRRFPGMAVVTVSMDGMMFSGGHVSTVQGSGTFAVFNYTSHVPSGHFTMVERCRLNR